jgi:NADPH-dependent 7-cyano-7-deazaguanine reductase QueF-like protein
MKTYEISVRNKRMNRVVARAQIYAPTYRVALYEFGKSFWSYLRSPSEYLCFVKEVK